MVQLLASLLVGLAGLLGGASPGPGPAGATIPPPTPRILCSRPEDLALRRFEDRSAQVVCAGHVLARISVPG